MVISITEQALSPSLTDSRHFTINMTVPTVTYTVNTLFTSNPAVVRDWIQNLRTHYIDYYSNDKLLLGIAVQPGLQSRRQAAIVTLCSGGNCLMVPLQRNPNAAAELNTLFNDIRITFVGLYSSEDIRRRIKPLDMHSKMPLNALDYTSSCRDGSLNKTVLLIAREVNKIWLADMNTGCDLSDWKASKLGLEQVRHATVEALMPFLFGDGIGVWMFSPVHHRN